MNDKANFPPATLIAELFSRKPGKLGMRMRAHIEELTLVRTHNAGRIKINAVGEDKSGFPALVARYEGSESKGELKLTRRIFKKPTRLIGAQTLSRLSNPTMKIANLG